MKARQLALILVLLAALGGLALFLRGRSSSSWKSNAVASSDKVLSFPVNDVTHITVKSAGGEVNLLKKEEAWKVMERDDYPADFNQVAALIRKLWELRPTQELEVGPSQLGRLLLNKPDGSANSAMLLELKGKNEQRLAALLVGKKFIQDSSTTGTGGIPAGRYVMSADGGDRAFLTSDNFEDLQLMPPQWLNHDFIKVENPKSISVTAATSEVSWKVVRENASATWTLQGAKVGEEFNPAIVTTMASYLATLNFTDVLAPDAPPSDTGLDKPSTIEIETFDGFTYQLRIGTIKGNDYPLTASVKAALPTERTSAPQEKPDDKATLDQQFRAGQKQLAEKLAKEEKYTTRPYLLAKTVVDQLLQDRRALLKPPASPSPSVTPAAPAPVPKSRSSPSPSPLRRHSS